MTLQASPSSVVSRQPASQTPARRSFRRRRSESEVLLRDGTRIPLKPQRAHTNEEEAIRSFISDRGVERQEAGSADIGDIVDIEHIGDEIEILTSADLPSYGIDAPLRGRSYLDD